MLIILFDIWLKEYYSHLKECKNMTKDMHSEIFIKKTSLSIKSYVEEFKKKINVKNYIFYVDTAQDWIY